MPQANSQRCFALLNMTDEGNRFNASSLQRIIPASARA
jgi:hypothetical protein